MGIRNNFDPAKTIKKREFVVEDYLREKIASIGGKCYKFVSPGYDGMPDRLVLYRGNVVFIECKRPGEKPRKLQQVRLNEIRDQNVPAFWIDSKGQVDILVARLTGLGRIHG